MNCLCGIPVGTDLSKFQEMAAVAEAARATLEGEEVEPSNSTVPHLDLVAQLVLHPELNWPAAVGYWGACCTCEVANLTVYAEYCP